MSRCECIETIPGVAQLIGRGVRLDAVCESDRPGAIAIAGRLRPASLLARELASAGRDVILLTTRTSDEIPPALHRRLAATPGITLRTATEVVAVDGVETLEVVVTRDLVDGTIDAIAVGEMVWIRGDASERDAGDGGLRAARRS